MCRGSITIYLALVFTLVLGLICTVVESGRVSAIKAKTESITYMSLDSSFSEYTRELFEDYGLLFLWSTQSELENSIEEYTIFNCDLKKGILSSNTDFYGIGLTKIEIENIAKATDNGGQVFANEVGRYMKYAAVENVLESILSEINIFNQGGKVKDFYDKIADFSDKLTKVEETVGSIKEKIDEIQSCFESPDILIDELLVKAEVIQSKMLDGTSYSEELSEFQNSFDELKATKDGLITGLLEIKNQTDIYNNDTQEAAGVVQELGKELEEEKEDLDTENYNLLNQEVSDISTKATITDSDYYGVTANSYKVTDMMSMLNKIDTYYYTGGKYLNSENIGESITNLKSLKTGFSGLSLDSLGVNFDSLKLEKDEDSIIDYINNIVSDGILGFVTEDSTSLSEVGIDSTQLPSITCLTEQPEETDSMEIEESLDKIVYSEYLLSHFGNYLEPKEDTKLKYELEYILSGKSTDKENLSSVAIKLMLLREGSNFIYLLKDSEKRGEAYQMATTLVGFTGMPLLITVTQFLILGAWALAESIVDVKNLMKGEEVSILKSDSEWNLSLFGAKNLGNSSGDGSQAKAGALNYQQYLRILLLMENKNQQYFRTMDVIQLNVCENYNSSFRMTDCISSVGIKVKYSAKPLFTSFPFVKKLTSNQSNSYNIVVSKSYSY